MSDAIRPAAMMTAFDRTPNCAPKRAITCASEMRPASGGRIVRRARSAILAAHRTDMHDAAMRRFGEQWQEHLGADERAFQVGREDVDA